MTNIKAENFFHSLDKFGIRLGLENIQILLERLGNPQKNMKFIHVAGTNGKGSICSMLSAILKAAGFKTGLYISPYVIDFRERIQINNEMIPKNRLGEITEKVAKEVNALKKNGVVITEFEAVTATGLLYFYEENCDYVVLEVGLGGRFDATNVIDKPLVSVITSISLAHTAVLGDTIEKIAFEKCGIIKQNCPVVTNSVQNDKALTVIKDIAKTNNSPLYIADINDIKISESSIYGTHFEYKQNEYYLPLAGLHQVENACTAIKICEILDIDTQYIQTGLHNVKNPARIEVVSKNPLIIIDGSHNEAGTKALSDYIQKYLANKKIIGIIGMMSDKDIEHSILNVIKHFNKIYTTTPTNPRAINADDLAKIINKHKNIATPVNSPITAVKQAKNELENFDALIICGSLYLASEVRKGIIDDQPRGTK